MTRVPFSQRAMAPGRFAYGNGRHASNSTTGQQNEGPGTSANRLPSDESTVQSSPLGGADDRVILAALNEPLHPSLVYAADFLSPSTPLASHVSLQVQILWWLHMVESAQGFLHF
ncbi:hypothetical protein PCL_12736 [Purpureocillium lilacinum]|uniref:Uncharacterized protein n=1 Tax=Purpureocillium lilacinum TaxID=33203 RepID=A0A2U3E780_PURLI|nr:hypothetical protein PCL_12736 [Purpureocillium lilacinum]